MILPIGVSPILNHVYFAKIFKGENPSVYILLIPNLKQIRAHTLSMNPKQKRDDCWIDTVLYADVIMGPIASQITSLTIVYSIVYSDADQRKHQSSASLAFVWGIHRDRWIPRTKGQLRGKCFHLMTSSWYPVKYAQGIACLRLLLITFCQFYWFHGINLNTIYRILAHVAPKKTVDHRNTNN